MVGGGPFLLVTLDFDLANTENHFKKLAQFIGC